MKKILYGLMILAGVSSLASADPVRYIQSRNTLQSGTTIYVSSGTSNNFLSTNSTITFLNSSTATINNFSSSLANITSGTVTNFNTAVATITKTSSDQIWMREGYNQGVYFVGSGTAPYTLSSATNTYAYQTPFFMEGFNLRPGTVDGKLKTSLHQMVWEKCFWFYDGAKNLAEWNFNFQSSTGSVWRPMKYDFDLDTTYQTWWLSGDVIDFVKTNDTDRFARFTTTGSYVNGQFQIGGDTGPRFVYTGSTLTFRVASDNSEVDVRLGSTTVAGDILTDIDNSKSIGQRGRRYSKVYTREVNAGINAITLKTEAADIRFHGGSGGNTEFFRITDTGDPRLFKSTNTTVPIINSSYDLVSSTLTPTKLLYLGDVTSDIQRQINAKANSSTPTITGTVTAARFISGNGSGLTTFVDGDTTPSVALNNVYTTGNTAPTTITQFDEAPTGMIIHIVCGDANTTLSNSNFYLAGGVAFVCTGQDAITLIRYGAGWLEISRSINQ